MGYLKFSTCTVYVCDMSHGLVEMNERLSQVQQ